MNAIPGISWQAVGATLEGLSRRILIADANVDEAQAIRYQLMRYGIEAVEARDGLEAREFLRRETPALVLMAADLPRISGIDLLALMRTGGLGEEDVPVVVRSRSQDVASSACAREWGAEAVVDEGLESGEVAATIADLLKL